MRLQVSYTERASLRAVHFLYTQFDIRMYSGVGRGRVWGDTYSLIGRFFELVFTHSLWLVGLLECRADELNVVGFDPHTSKGFFSF